MVGYHIISTVLILLCGLMVWYSENITVEGNTIINITTNDDSYNVGIMLWKNNKVTIDNNNLIDE